MEVSRDKYRTYQGNNMAKNNNTQSPISGIGPSGGRGLGSLQNGPGFGATTLPPNIVFPGSITPVMASPSVMMSQQRLAWFMVDALWGGTSAMRLLGEQFLPKEAFETQAEYDNRLKRATLVNYYKNTIQDAAGRVFAKDVKLISASSELTDIGNATVPPQPEFQNFAVDVDAQGNNLTQFVKGVFEQAVNHGVGFILVDYPRIPVESFESLEKQVDSGARPYWVNITASNVLDCRRAMIGGKQRLTLFKYEETVNELASDNITPTTYQQVRIYKHDADQPNAAGGTDPSSPMYAIYRRYLNGVATVAGGTGASSNSNWTLLECGYLTNADGEALTGIPVVPVYANRIGYGMGTPALQDLADLNITHYQCNSDYLNICHLANVPFLFGKGMAAAMDANGVKQPIILSPGRAMTTDVDYADIKWVEHSGSSIASARNLLQDLEKQMKECGLKLTQEVAPQGRTATEVAVNVAESNSRLKSMAVATQDALNLALYYTSEFLGIPDLTRAKISTDFADILASANDAQWLSDAFTKGAIDAETLIYEYQRRNIIDPSTDVEPPEENEATVLSENVSLTAAPTTTDTTNAAEEQSEAEAD